MKKRVFALLLCLALTLISTMTLVVSADETDLGYTINEETKTITVSTAKGLVAVSALTNTAEDTYRKFNITLAADIDFATIPETDTQYSPIARDPANVNPANEGYVAYAGTFDGAGHTISNMMLKGGSSDRYEGLIGTSDSGCVIKNLTVSGANITGREYLGTLVGKAIGDLTIQNCHVKNVSIAAGATNGNNVGGLVGRFDSVKDTTILVENCTINANLTSFRNVGGVSGSEGLNAALGFNATFRNIVVAGEFETFGTSDTHGCAGIFSYNGGSADNADTHKITFENCISLAKLTSFEPGAMTNRVMNGIYTVKNCIGFGGFSSTVSLAMKEHTIAVSGSYIYDPATTDKTASYFAKSVTNPADESIVMTIDETAVPFNTATLPVLDAAGVVTKATEIYASADEGFKTAALALINLSAGHVHVFDQENPTASFLKSAATCNAKAVYYKSCTCGLKGEETFEYGEFAAHSFAKVWSYDEAQHWHVCIDCQTEKSDIADHTFTDWEVKREATERREGERERSCTICGYYETEKIPKVTAEETTVPTTPDSTPANGETTTTTPAAASKKGCGATVSGSAILVAALIPSVCLFVRKKKED